MPYFMFSFNKMLRDSNTPRLKIELNESFPIKESFPSTHETCSSSPYTNISIPRLQCEVFVQGYVCHVKCRTWAAARPREAIPTNSAIAVLSVHVDFQSPQNARFPKVFEAPREYFPLKCSG